MDEMYIKGILYAAKLAEQDAKQLEVDDPQTHICLEEIITLNDFAGKLRSIVSGDINESGIGEYQKYSPTSD